MGRRMRTRLLPLMGKSLAKWYWSSRALLLTFMIGLVGIWLMVELKAELAGEK